MRRLVGAAVLLACLGMQVQGRDWPTYGGDPARSGYTAEELPAKLTLRWHYQALQAPVPAWPRSDRQQFDRAFHPVIAGGMLYFGSSADGKVYALDTESGKERWSFYTGGPVRFAPALWKDRVYVGSDDGQLYCLSGADGKLLWKKRGGPDERLLLGNDRLIAQWPARGGPAIVDGVVYFAAGVWPSDGIYLYALDADSGKPVWVNDKSGAIYMAQPHGGANANSGLSAQGYLVANGEQLLVPTGRAVPAVLNRADGKFLYFQLQLNGHRGGASTVALGEHFFNAGQLYNAKTGNWMETVGAGALASGPDGIVRGTDKEVNVSRLVDKQKVDRKGNAIKIKGLEKVWTVPGSAATAVVVAGKQIVAAGGQQVSIIDMTAKKVSWSTEVDGIAYGLAVADGKLFVSTDRGSIYCFDGKDTATPVVIKREAKSKVYGANEAAAAAAEAIIRQGGVTEGYCVDLACGDGALAYELARRTKLQIHAIDKDPALIESARRKLDAAGLLGTRVTVHVGDPARTLFPKYFANLIVSGRSVSEGIDAVAKAEVNRLQRPYGGVACVGKPDSISKSVRGPLAGAGSWTHQYADPGNTSCSSDTLVKGPLGMLWFRDSDFDMPQRHGRGPAPLFYEGLLLVEGLNALRGVDAYNGRVLWEYPLDGILKPYNGEHLMGASGTGSNYCVSKEGVFVRAGAKCLRLEAATGKKLAEFDAPVKADGKPGIWGYIACESGILFGSLVNDDHIVKWRYGKGDMSQQFTESKTFFALDAVTGKPKWTYQAKQSLRHNAIAVGGGKVFLIDRPIAEIDWIVPPAGEKEKPPEHRPGELLALDAASGKVAWKEPEDVFGTVLAVSAKHDALLMGYQPTAFKLPSEKGGKLRVFRASEGKKLWEVSAVYGSRPVIIDGSVYAQGGSWDLLTGDVKLFPFKRSYGCGQLACSDYLMVFRSATLGYYDLLRNKEVENYGGIRPGCWINAIPAGGIVLVPDASAGCQCSYLNQAWIALQNRE